VVDVTARSWAGGRSGSPGAGWTTKAHRARSVRVVTFPPDHTVELAVANHLGDGAMLTQ